MAFHSQGSTLAPLHSAPLDPLTPLDVLLSSPPTSGSASLTPRPLIILMCSHCDHFSNALLCLLIVGNYIFCHLE